VLAFTTVVFAWSPWAIGAFTCVCATTGIRTESNAARRRLDDGIFRYSCRQIMSSKALVKYSILVMAAELCNRSTCNQRQLSFRFSLHLTKQASIVNLALL
jgi:hypothetical protein